MVDRKPDPSATDKSVSSKFNAFRIICVNDIYTFDNASGHGGFASVSTLINRLRSEYGKNCFVTVNGDFLGGSSLAEQTKGKVIIDILNYMNIDAVVLGNHEFDFSTQVLEERISESNFSWFGSNVTSSVTEDHIPGTISTKVIKSDDGLQIGVFGICTPSTPFISYPCKTTQFSDPVQCSRVMIDTLKAEADPDLVVALTHLRQTGDLELAENINGIDVILGGHDHDPFLLHKNRTLILKCGQNGYWVGVLDIKWRRLNGSFEHYLTMSLQSTCDVDQDPGVLDIAGRHYADQNPEHALLDLDEPIVEMLGVPLDTRTSTLRVSEASSGNLVADCLYAFFTSYGAEPDLALINGGFIRGDKLYDRERDGSHITKRIVFEEMPFPKNAVCIDISGISLLGAIEQHIRDYPHASGAFPHFSSNVRIQFTHDKIAGNRIHLFTINNIEIDHTRRYRLATSAFIASGGDGCSHYYNTIVVPELPERRISDIVVWALERHRDQNTPVYLNVDGRITDSSSK